MVTTNQILLTTLTVGIVLSFIGYMLKKPHDLEAKTIKKPVDCICQCPEKDEENPNSDKEEENRKECITWIKTDKGKWMPHKLLPAIGTTKHTAARSCTEIRDALMNDWAGPPQSDKYWLNPFKYGDIIPVYCEMSLDGGGWILVWKHSYMEVGSLSEDMKYFSKHYRPCTDIETGWCNIPNKARLNPKHMMIVGYRNKVARFAYKGKFNHDIDHNWSGGILVVPKKILDECTINIDIEPAPSAHGGDRRLLGIAFDKCSQTKYLLNCVTIAGEFSSPTDCRWHDCHHKESAYRNTQMTVAIYVR